MHAQPEADRTDDILEGYQIVHKKAPYYQSHFVTGALKMVTPEILRLSYFNKVEKEGDKLIFECDGEWILTKEAAEKIRDLLDIAIAEMEEMKEKGIEVPQTAGLDRKIDAR